MDRISEREVTTIKALKSEIIDTIIVSLEHRLKDEKKHLLKTDTIFRMCQAHFNLDDAVGYRKEFLDIGARQVIQSRLYAHGYFSVQIGYFVKVDECKNIGYLNLMIKGKDNVIEDKIAARNRIKELKAMDGQMVFVPDENNVLTPIETKTKDEIVADLEADAI